MMTFWMMIMNRDAIVICHGSLASGFKSNIETILGKCDNLHAFSNDDIDISDLINKIRVFIDTNHITNPYFFVDLKGGSCWKAAKLLMKEFDKSFLISGLNIAVLIKFLSVSDEEFSLEWLLERGKQSLMGEK